MAKKETREKGRIAVVRVRGRVNIRKPIADTLKLLNLTRVNHCVVVPNTPQYTGMVNKAKDYITWGEINPDTAIKLLQKRARLDGNKRLDDEYLAKNTRYKSIDEFAKAFINLDAELKEVPELKPVFRLRPPKKGYERAGIKKPFSVGGALGYRKDEINDLLGKMI
ncbi:MAG: 50S ribosomal protein L30 [Candidatus Altiarchaeales archaeon WOR_SM1_86-2]|nr:MAG: 50S ribosomal protein L30 [Candidatus Altiarchaeales archaeon WOR_SM1_86-2]